MQVNTISNTIISTLGNPSSLIPLAVKDTINSAGITYFSYDAGGKLEGKDRLIDEFGTQAIWLFGLPTFKKIADKTFYKYKKLNPNVDVRVVNSKEHVEFAKSVLKNYSPESKETLNSIETAVNRLPEFKKLFYSKFALATILTFASYFALTKYKQKITEKAVIKDYMKQKANENFLNEKNKDSKTFGNFEEIAFSGKKKTKPAFKGLEAFMFNPVKNLMIIDAGITTERLHKSRNKYEFAEYAIKEGSLLFFMYVAGGWIQKGLQNVSAKLFKTPIDMDLRFINSEQLKKSMGSMKMFKEVKAFSKLGSQKDVLDFIANNQKSIIVEGGKISDLIGQFKDGNINPAKYIDTNELKKMAKNLETFIKRCAKSGLSIEEFMKKARNHKIAAILANIGICCGALGYVMPKTMYEYRKKFSGTKEFHVANQVREKLAQSFSSNKI